MPIQALCSTWLFLFSVVTKIQKTKNLSKNPKDTYSYFWSYERQNWNKCLDCCFAHSDPVFLNPERSSLIVLTKCSELKVFAHIFEARTIDSYFPSWQTNHCDNRSHVISWIFIKKCFISAEIFYINVCFFCSLFQKK